MALTIDIGARITGFMQQVGLVRKQLQQFGGGIGAGGMLSNLIGIGGASAAMYAVKSLAENMDQMQASARNMNMTVMEFQRLRLASGLADISVESLGGSFQKMRKFLNDLAVTGKSGGELETIGLQLKDLQGLGTQDQFMAIARALNTMKDATMREYVAAQIFGKAWQEVDGMMKDLPAAMERAGKASMIDEETVNNWAAANDELALMKSNFTALAATTFGGKTGALGLMNDALQLQNQYLKENREIWASWFALQNVDPAKIPLITGIGQGIMSGITNGVFPPRQ
jgi:hypothetical protein